ncbi:putative peroxidase [Dioscorea sansibarensis]
MPRSLIKQCPAGASGAVTVNNDPVTASIFDNQYYKNLISGKGLFSSDSVLMSDSRTRARIESLSANQDEFFKRWSESFLRMVSIGVKTRNDQGVIRANCFSFNG